MCVVARLNSTQLRSPQHTRHVLASGPVQSRQDPSFPRRSGSRPSPKVYSVSFSGPSGRFSCLPLLRGDGSIVPPNKALESLGCSMEPSVSLSGHQYVRCHRAAGRLTRSCCPALSSTLQGVTLETNRGSADGLRLSSGLLPPPYVLFVGGLFQIDRDHPGPGARRKG